MIEIYTSIHCYDCKSLKNLFATKGLEFEEYDIEFSKSIKLDLFNRAAKIFHWQEPDAVKVPMVFVDKKCIGNLDDVYSLIENNTFNEVFYK